MQDNGESGDSVTTSKDPASLGTAGDGDTTRNESVVTRLMRAGNDEVDALLEALGMRDQLSGEAQDIARLIERRLAEVAWGDHAHALDQLEIQRAFLVLRGYSVLDNFLNLTSILAGVGGSLAVALNAPKVYAIVLGLLVGLLQSISQWLKPSQRSTRRGIAAAYLRSEAWAFLQGRDRYRGKDDRIAWGLLCDQINKVQTRESAQQDQEAAQVHEAYGVPR
jgi:hypothetical protein